MRTALSLIIMLMCLHAFAQPVKKQRLIAVFHHLYNADIVDTILYSYSGDRGITEFKPHAFRPGNGVYGFEYYYGWIDPRISAENMPEPVGDVYDNNIFPDVVIRKEDPAMKDFDTIYHLYDKNNIIAIRLKDTHIENTFNSANRPLLSNYTRTTGNGTVQTYKRVIAYDEKQRVIADTSLSDNNALPAQFMYGYTYNADGTIAMRTEYQKKLEYWEPVTRDEYKYNAAGKITEFERPYWLNTHWGEGQHNIYTFDSAARLTSNFLLYTNDTQQSYKLIYNSNSPLADTLVRYSYDLSAVTVCYKTTFYYNSYGYPDYAITQAFANCTTPTPEIHRTYYKYETYEVADTPTTDNGRFVIYPNPADKQIHIRWNWKQPNEPVYMQVYDAIGREVLKSYVPKANKTESLDVSSLLPGVYILRIRTESGKKVHTEKFTVY